MLLFSLDADVLYETPLACDPAMQAANPPKPDPNFEWRSEDLSDLEALAILEQLDAKPVMVGGELAKTVQSAVAVLHARRGKGRGEDAAAAARIVLGGTIDPLDDLRYRGDASGLTIPPDATIVRFRSMSVATRAKARRAAGPQPLQGAILSSEASTHATMVRAREKRLGRPHGPVVGHHAISCFVDALEPGARRAHDDFVEWDGREDFFQCVYGVVALGLADEATHRAQGTQLDEWAPDKEGRFPANLLEAMARDQPALIGELAGHIRRASELSGPGKARSYGRCGGSTTGTLSGTVETAAETPTPTVVEATAADPSAPTTPT